MHIAPHAHRDAKVLIDTANAIHDPVQCQNYMDLLVDIYPAVPANAMEYHLIAFAAFQIEQEAALVVLHSTMLRLDKVTNLYELDGTLEALRRVTAADETTSAAFDRATQDYVQQTTPDRARTVETVRAGKAHSRRDYPQALKVA